MQPVHLRLTLSFDEYILFFDLKLNLAEAAHVNSICVVIMFWLNGPSMLAQSMMQVILNIDRIEWLLVFKLYYFSVIVKYAIDLP